MFLISLYAFLLSRFSAPLSQQPCHTTAKVSHMQQCPALSPWGHSLQKGWGEGHREVKGLLGPNGSCSSKQRCPARHLGVILPRAGKTDGQTPCWPRQCSWTFFPSSLFFFLLILSWKPRSFKDVHVSLALP